MVFRQSPRTRKQSRTPTARAAGTPELEILVDAHERYPYTFGGQQVRTTRKALRCGDYGVTLDGRTVAAVERKSLSDLMSSLTSGRLRFAMAELAALPRAAVVVEDRYPRIFAQTLVRPAASELREWARANGWTVSDRGRVFDDRGSGLAGRPAGA